MFIVLVEGEVCAPGGGGNGRRGSRCGGCVPGVGVGGDASWFDAGAGDFSGVHTAGTVTGWRGPPTSDGSHGAGLADIGISNRISRRDVRWRAPGCRSHLTGDPPSGAQSGVDRSGRVV